MQQYFGSLIVDKKQFYGSRVIYKVYFLYNKERDSVYVKQIQYLNESQRGRGDLVPLPRSCAVPLQFSQPLSINSSAGNGEPGRWKCSCGRW